VAGILSAVSSLVAVSLSRRIGLIRTMVFTHLPSAIALCLIPIPSSLVVLPQERTAVMGFISVVRTFSQSCGPLVTGILAQAGKFWVTFVVAGTLKATYDLGLLAGFRSHKADIDRAEGRAKIVDEEEE
jgi:hypothetical protein